MSIFFSSPMSRGGACPIWSSCHAAILRWRSSVWPAFHYLLHHVPEDDGYVPSLGSCHNHKAAAERLRMRGLNAIPHFLSQAGIADECSIPTMGKTHSSTCLTPKSPTPVGNPISVVLAQVVTSIVWGYDSSSRSCARARERERERESE